MWEDFVTIPHYIACDNIEGVPGRHESVIFAEASNMKTGGRISLQYGRGISQSIVSVPKLESLNLRCGM